MKEFINILGKERVFSGQDIPESYTIDDITKQEGSAIGVVFPTSIEEVKEIIAIANKKRLSIVIKGAGTGLTGATLPVQNELILDFSKMNRILDLDEETMTLTVEPGVTLEEIRKFADEKGYFYPPDPGSKEASIGGTVATNAGGMRAVKYGVTRDYIRGLEVVLLSGEVLQLGGLTIKNSSGYDLKDLFIGSEGTLGITTKVQLKLIAPPAYNQSLLISFDSLTDVSKTVLDILKNNVDPTALEFFETDAIRYGCDFLQIEFPLKEGQAFLLITLDGASENSIQTRIQQIDELSKKHNSKELLVLTDKKQADDIWKVRDSITSGIRAVSQQEPIDIGVPLSRVTDTINFMKKLGKEHDLPFVCFGHAGDGNVHACILRRDLSLEEWEERLATVLSKLYHQVATYQGIPSAEHGIGLLKKEYFIKESDDIYISYLRKIKKVFDPENRLNPTKVF